MTEAEINATLQQAILARRRVLITYADDGADPHGGRLVEPHALGLGSAGQGLVSVFQVWGASSSGEGFGWKMLRTDRIREVALSTGDFEQARDSFNRERCGIFRPLAMV